MITLNHIALLIGTLGYSAAMLANTPAAQPPTPEKTASDPSSHSKDDSVKPTPSRGQRVYEAKCSLCHDPEPMVPVGAPTIGDRKAWAPRLKKLKKDPQALLNSVIHGLGAMPRRGTCVRCSVDDLRQAIAHMLPKKTSAPNTPSEPSNPKAPA